MTARARIGILAALAGLSSLAAAAAATAPTLPELPGSDLRTPAGKLTTAPSGVQFDGEIVATRHTFVPFSPRSHGAKYFPDAYFMDQGQACRITVLNVRGKTVIVFVDNVALPADQFPAFLIKADKILASVRLPG